MRRIGLKWAIIAIAVGLLITLIGGFAIHHFGFSGGNADIAVCPQNTCIQVTGSSPGPVLYPSPPGAPGSALPITFTNLTNGPIYVTSVAVNFTNPWQTGCSAGEFQITDPSVTGSSTSVSGSTTTIGFSPSEQIQAGQTWTDNAGIALPDNNTNQNGCGGQPLSLSYTATAQYTVPTTTALSETQNAGSDTATLTATVAPDIMPAAAGRPPGNGDGSVQFFECGSTNPSSCTTSLGTTSTWTSPGVASITIPAGTVGSYDFEAVFTPTDNTSFVGSSSPIINETLSGCVTVPTTSASTILRVGQTFNGNYTIGSGSSLWLHGGTINGNVTIAPGGQFATTDGTVNGNVQSSGGPIAISGTTVTGNVQTTNGGLSLGPSTVVKGNAQAQGGGPLCSQGTSPAQGQVQVRGNLQGQSLTSSTGSSVCSTIVGNNLQWQSNSSPVLIGSCGGNTVLGNLQVQYNSGKVTVGASGTGNGNATTGNTIVQSNTGGGTLTNNSSGGNCLLSGDNPGIVGSGNTTKGHNNQCNATA